MNLFLTTLLTTSVPRRLSWGRCFFVVFFVGFQADIHFTNGNSNKALVLVNKALLRRDWSWGGNSGQLKMLTKRYSRWLFQICCAFTLTWGNDPIWRAYSSDRLVQPPTSIVFLPVFLTGIIHWVVRIIMSKWILWSMMFSLLNDERRVATRWGLNANHTKMSNV